MIRLFLILISLICISCQKTETLKKAQSPAVIVEETSTDFIPWQFHGSEGIHIQTEYWNIYTTIQYEHIVNLLPN